MKLRKVRLQKFRNHTDSTLDIGDASFVVIKGDNLSGKTSIVQAMSMCLTPSTSGLDAQGRGFVRKIKRGEDKAVLSLDVQGSNHLIQRVVTLNTNTSGRTPKNTCLDDPGYNPLPFETFLAQFKDAMMVVLNTDYFTDRMDEKAQKNLLAKLALPERYEFPEDKVKATERALGEGAIDFNGEPFAVIAKGYKKSYDEREIVNRQVKEFIIPDALPMVAGVDSVSLQAELDTAREMRQKMTADKDKAVQAESDKASDRAKLIGKIETLQAEVATKKVRLDVVKQTMLTPAKLQELTALADKEAKLDTLQAERNFVKACISTKNAELKALESLPDINSVCPTCSQVIDGERLKKIAGDLAEARMAYVNRDTKAVQDIADLGLVAEAVSSIEANDKLVKEKKEIEEALTKIVETGKETRAKLNSLGDAVDVAASFTQPLADLETKITSLIDSIRPVIAAEERKIERATKEKLLTQLEEKASDLNTLVKFFDKDGIKAKLLSEYIGGFENKINDVIGAWGYKCALSIEPYEFLVTNAKGDTNEISELSGIEKLMFSIALQCAVSRSAGIGFIVADEMDTFLPHHRLKANRCLYQMTQNEVLEQVIMVVADTNQEAKKLNYAKFFFVTDGTVAEIQTTT